jgi:TolA-binding protein
MNQQDNIDLIEQYLNNELSESERNELEALLETDEVLANEFDRRQSAHQMIDFLISENLRSQLKNMEAEEHKVVSLVSRSRRMYALAIAASVVILIGAFFFLIPSGQNLSGQQLAMEYYESPAFTLRSSDDQLVEANLSAGIQALNSQNYDEAIQVLEEISSENDYYIMARYYLGHANFLTNNYTEAGNNFSEVVNSGDIRFLENAEWYELLSCLGQNTTCENLLDRILSNENHLHLSKALAIKNEQTK